MSIITRLGMLHKFLIRNLRIQKLYTGGVWPILTLGNWTKLKLTCRELTNSQKARIRISSMHFNSLRRNRNNINSKKLKWARGWFQSKIFQMAPRNNSRIIKTWTKIYLKRTRQQSKRSKESSKKRRRIIFLLSRWHRKN